MDVALWGLDTGTYDAKIFGMEPKNIGTFAARLKELRSSRGYSCESLGKEIDRSGQTIRNWENEESKPDLDELIALAACFKISVTDLIEPKTTPPTAKDLKAAQGMLDQLSPALAAIREAVEAAAAKKEIRNG